MTKRKMLIRISIRIIVVAFLSLLTIFCYTFFTIHSQVQSACRESQRLYGGDCFESLVRVLQFDGATYRQKNTAIWVLGQLADKRALPVLQQLYTGKRSGKESLDDTISQYELEKAIRWCREGNMTSWMYSITGNKNKE